MLNEKYPIKEEWDEYYKVLEGIRRIGVCNMYGAAPYLKAFCPELSNKESAEILINWMENYSELSKKFGWR